METIFADVDRYINDLFVKQDDVLEQVLQNNDLAGTPRWNISANQGKFLQVLAKLNNVKRILEIGTQGGNSTIWLARALSADGKLITMEINPDYADAARKNMILAGMDSIVDIRVGKALDTLAALFEKGEKPFDMIFLDADKPPYAEYLQWAIKLSRPGTLIVADNVVREGKILDSNCDDEVVRGIQRFNKMLAEDNRVTAIIIQSIGAKDHDGMAIAVVN